jgi:glutaminyl-tRNA synthetase
MHNKNKENTNFIESIIKKIVIEGKSIERIQTRFPPEPNGYLHIGHAKAICIDFGIVKKYGGICNLRFDDTNPVKENIEYINSILKDIIWLGFNWGKIYYTSDYFQKLWNFAIQLIQAGKAYVDEQSSKEIAEQKGTPNQSGINSPYRDRPIIENLDLFNKMNQGEITEGTMVLRAKIDMSSPNMHLRDPIIYRIIAHHSHHRTCSKWKVYPMYDFAHGQSDYFEGVTHSICTLEFAVHRPLYDWFIDQLKIFHPENKDYRPSQYEFNRLNLTYTVMSKRKLAQLIRDNIVNGWDDPRMPTLAGLRRRGYTPESIRNFIDKIGYTKFEALIDISLLEYSIREDLNTKAKRVFVVIDPIKLILINYPKEKIEMMEITNNPGNDLEGTHKIAFSRELYIEREDFMENASKNFYRLTIGKEVRLKNAYIIKCIGVKKNKSGILKEIYAEYYPQTKSGLKESNRKIKGTLHWVSIKHSIPAEVRLYDYLFTVKNPSEEKNFYEKINPNSLTIKTTARIEKELENASPLENFQFQRLGYFNVDPDSTKNKLIFNKTVSLKESKKNKFKFKQIKNNK